MSTFQDDDYPVGFCGDPFWDNFRPLAENASGPYGMPILTECFTHTVLAGAPCLFFWLLAPVLALQLRFSTEHKLPWTTLQSMKWTITLVLIVDRTFILVTSIWEGLLGDSPVPTVDYVYPSLQIVTLVALLVSMGACRVRGIRSNGVVFLTWLMFALFGAPEMYTWLKIGSRPELVSEVEFFRYCAYLVFYPLILIQLFLHCFTDPISCCGKSGYEEMSSPEARASFLNRQVMHWYSALVAKGNKKPLEVDDLFQLDEGLSTDNLAAAWNREWEKEKADYKARVRTYSLARKRASTGASGRGQNGRGQSDTSPLLAQSSKSYGSSGDEGADKKKKDKLEPKLPSIVWTLWRLFKYELIGASLIKLFSDLLQFMNPFFLNMLISFTEDPQAQWWEGVAYAVGLFLSNAIRTLTLNNYFTMMSRASIKMQSVLTTAVYEKTLRLSNSARREKTQGEIVNLMAIDVERFKSITPQIQQYWSSPLMIIVTLYLLWNSVGVAVIAGVAVMLSLIPLNIGVSIFCKKWQVSQMRLKDERIKMTNEVLSGIKVIKLYAWEPALEATIDKIRQEEVGLIKKASIVRTLCDIINIGSPFLVALSTFFVYTLDSTHILGPQIAFVSLALFNQLRGPLMMAADLIQQTVQAIVSNRRLKEFLMADELNPLSVDRESRAEFYDTVVDVDVACWSWDKPTPGAAAPPPANLDGIRLAVPRGQLLAVIGKVGSGKSSLLMGLLGEMEKLRGYVGVRGEAAFVPQQPWIQHKTLRENIVMDADFDQKRYSEVIEACALKPDLSLLPLGDQTEIGEKGINLSGGQKARVALARAVYQNRDLYLLDDPLSAVDAHVARHIFDRVIGPSGMLSGKTRILVTHGLSFLKDTDAIAVMKDGAITHVDTYSALLENEETKAILTEVEVQKKEEAESPSNGSLAEDEENDDEVSAGEEGGDAVSTLSRRSRKSSRASKKSQMKELARPSPQTAKLIEAETAAIGRVSPSVYMSYFRSMGIVHFVLPCLIAMCTSTGFQMARSLWLTAWSDDNALGADPSLALPLGTRLGIYALFGTSEIAFLYIGLACMILGGVNASVKLHRPLLHNVLRAPLSFFDVTPMGRILNRLGKDMEVVDLRLSSNFRFLIIAFLNVMQTIIIIASSVPIFVAVIIPVLIIYILVLRYFIDSSRQMQRLASITRSPIYSHFGETIQGAATIRGFGWVDKFCEASKRKLETHIRCCYFSLLSNRWLSVRLEMLGSAVILSTALLAVWSKTTGSMSAGVVGLCVSYSLNITFMLNMFVRQISETETNVVAVERIKDYSTVDSEAEWRSLRPPPRDWPPKGELIMTAYATRYRRGLDLVLRDVTAHFLPGEKIGVVGRTGAGKSSLALALFRIVEPAGGKIVLDDIDVSTIGLHELRENLTIIPQDPVLFSGTLRFNLDPTGQYSDADLWTALEHSSLKEFVEALPRGLEGRVDEGGDNISVGQRQLVCLTRALLRRSRVLVLDEATAAIDSHTDALIQTTIRREFADSTVVTIAHRLNTIMDYDKIMVMDGGKIAEFAPPNELLADSSSVFHQMAKAAKLID